jgi:hypothetical protein
VVPCRSLGWALHPKGEVGGVVAAGAMPCLRVGRSAVVAAGMVKLFAKGRETRTPCAHDLSVGYIH